MPELAEVHTFKSQLEPILVGKKIVAIDITHPRTMRRHQSLVEVKTVEGAEVTGIDRFGKYLSIGMSNSKFLNIHLRMSGRFVLKKQDSDIQWPKHTHAVIETVGYKIGFVDPRTFGEIWITEMPAREFLPGVDAFESNQKQIKQVLEGLKTKRNLKTVLLDQKFIAGLGNIYADEVCFEAKLAPNRGLDTLTSKNLSEIAIAINKVLKNAIELRGTSLQDESFRDLYGELGSYQKIRKVHARQGDKCPRCETKIVKSKIAGRSTYYCPNCQQ